MDKWPLTKENPARSRWQIWWPTKTLAWQHQRWNEGHRHQQALGVSNEKSKKMSNRNCCEQKTLIRNTVISNHVQFLEIS